MIFLSWSNLKLAYKLSSPSYVQWAVRFGLFELRCFGNAVTENATQTIWNVFLIQNINPKLIYACIGFVLLIGNIYSGFVLWRNCYSTMCPDQKLTRRNQMIKIWCDRNPWLNLCKIFDQIMADLLAKKGISNLESRSAWPNLDIYTWKFFDRYTWTNLNINGISNIDRYTGQQCYIKFWQIYLTAILYQILTDILDRHVISNLDRYTWKHCYIKSWQIYLTAMLYQILTDILDSNVISTLDRYTWQKCYIKSWQKSITSGQDWWVAQKARGEARSSLHVTWLKRKNENRMFFFSNSKQMRPNTSVQDICVILHLSHSRYTVYRGFEN